jgi:signal transduction histidine kinase
MQTSTRPVQVAAVAPGALAQEIGPIRILLVEDSPSDAMLMEAELREAAPECVVARASSLADSRTALLASRYDIVLLDLGLPDSDGLDTFRAIAEMAANTAIVVISGLDDELTAETAVRLGAQDYLVKGTIKRGHVVRAVCFAMRRNQILIDLAQALTAQLEEKDCFLSHVSHELRSPLAVIHQFVSLLVDGVAGPLSDDQADYLAVTVRNIEQLRLMIDDLLNVGRLGHGRLVLDIDSTQLHELLTDCTRAHQLAATERSITITLAAPTLPLVECDPRRTREVIDNLLDNALKFTADGRSVEVRATFDEEKVSVSVRDTGRGIRSENVDRIFEQFFQELGPDEAPRNGLGLGLFIARQIVELQGGRIWIESAVGEGTTATFTLPLTFPGG